MIIKKSFRQQKKITETIFVDISEMNHDLSLIAFLMTSSLYCGYLIGELRGITVVFAILCYIMPFDALIAPMLILYQCMRGISIFLYSSLVSCLCTVNSFSNNNDYYRDSDCNNNDFAMLKTVQHMFTDQNTGRQLSYGEMRTCKRYG